MRPPAASQTERTPRRRLLTAAVIFLLVAATIALTARDPGLTWDEAIYLGQAVRYADFIKTLSSGMPGKEEILRTYWQPDHPPLAKIWIALSLILFDGDADPIRAARIGAGMLFGLAAAALYLWVSRHRGEPAGIFATMAFVLMPRVFADGHFANIEMATLLLWFLTTVAFEAGIRDKRWSVACGVVFGLALLTKINAVFLPIALVPWGLVFHGRKTIPNIVAMALLGPLMFLGGWPVMWYHPVAATTAYIANKLTRQIVEVYYLGITYDKTYAPWHYPFVMLAATTPLPILAAAVTGAWRNLALVRATWREAGHEALVLWSFAFPVILLSLPGVPKYDGIRLMLPALPFLAVLAATGADWAWRGLRARVRNPRATAWICGAVFGTWLLVPVIAFHPFQLCYYSEIVGGPWGAQRMGFETTYWHETFDSKALAYLNEYARGTKVALVPIEYRVLRIYQVLGELANDVGHTNFESGDWDYLVVVPRQGKLDKSVREFMATHKPVWVSGLPPFGSPPVCLIYRRP